MGWVLAGIAVAGGLASLFGGAAERERQKKLLKIKREQSRLAQAKDVKTLGEQYSGVSGSLTARMGRAGVESATGAGGSAELTSTDDLQLDAGGMNSSELTNALVQPRALPSAPQASSEYGGTPLLVQQYVADTYAADVIYRRKMGELERQSLDAQMPSDLEYGLGQLATIIETGTNLYMLNYGLNKNTIPGTDYSFDAWWNRQYGFNDR